MNKIILILLLGLVAVVGLVAYNSFQKKAPATTPLTASQVQSAVRSGALLVDVREPSEFASGHVENATNIPLGDIEAGQLKDVKKDREIYLYCHSGRRAGLAKQVLSKTGYTNVTSLGGLEDWKHMGGTLVP